MGRSWWNPPVLVKSPTGPPLAEPKPAFRPRSVSLFEPGTARDLGWSWKFLERQPLEHHFEHHKMRISTSNAISQIDNHSYYELYDLMAWNHMKSSSQFENRGTRCRVFVRSRGLVALACAIFRDNMIIFGPILSFLLWLYMVIVSLYLLIVMTPYMYIYNWIV